MVIAKTQAGFGLITLFILVAAVVLAFLIGERIYSIRQAVKSVQDYTECIKVKGAKVLQTTPEQCILDGKVFVNIISPPKN